MMYVNNTLWFCVAVSFFFFVSETSGKQELVKWKLWVGSIVHRLANVPGLELGKAWERNRSRCTAHA